MKSNVCVLILLGAVLLALLSENPPTVRAGGEPAAPPDTTAYWPRMSLMNGTWYCGSLVWMTSLACTTALKERGCKVYLHEPYPYRDDVDSTLLGIGVKWPVTLPRDSFPPCVFSVLPDRW